jgi:hypothetical protein
MVPSDPARRAGFNISEFESDMGGISDSNFDVQKGFSSFRLHRFAPICTIQG